MTTPSSSATEVLQVVEEIASQVIARNAGPTDRDGAFPEENIAILGQMGMLGLVTDTRCGGLGFGLDAASRVVTRIARECPR